MSNYAQLVEIEIEFEYYLCILNSISNSIFSTKYYVHYFKTAFYMKINFSYFILAWCIYYIAFIYIGMYIGAHLANDISAMALVAFLPSKFGEGLGSISSPDPHIP